MLRALIFLLPLALLIYAFIDCLNTPEDEVQHLPKVVWILIILLFAIVGPVGWIAAGKKRHARAGGPLGGGAWSNRDQRRQEWVAPDDNPEFLASLREENNKKDESLLKDWEADLRRREEELRRREQRDGQGESGGGRGERDGRGGAGESGGRGELGEQRRRDEDGERA